MPDGMQSFVTSLSNNRENSDSQSPDQRKANRNAW